jgi:hypothetical protein
LIVAAKSGEVALSADMESGQQLGELAQAVKNFRREGDYS